MSRSLRVAWCLGFLVIVCGSSVPADETSEQLLTRARTALSQIEGDIRLPGLIEPVEVLRDRWGVPHIYAKNSHDLFLAQGFVAAQDRLFQLDLWRRIGVGETAAVLGEQALEADRFARLLLYRGDMQAEWKSYSPDTQDIATAFTQGINACIDQAGQKLPIEFQVLGYAPKKWRPEDVLSRMSGIIMSGNWQREVVRARLIAAVGVERARLVAPTDPPRDYAPAPDLDLQAIQPAILQGYLAASRPLKFTPNASESNNWVVDGSLSTSRKPLLASDPHRPIALPSLRYLVHLHAPGWNVIGAGEPALPGVAIGHNERIAWGFTIVGTDQADLYVEQTDPGDPQRYRAGDGWEPMRIVHDTIRVKGREAPVEVELRFTRHGPVIYQDEQKHLAFALRWAGSEPGGAGYLGSLAVARAQNRAEFLRALESWKIPCLNFVYADVAGTIGWVAAALTPIRQGWDGLLPVPGAAGKYEWQGFLRVPEYPQSFDPPQHWFATANHNILPAGYAREISYEWEAPFRYQRIEQRLKERAVQEQKFTLDDFQSIQHEATSLPAQALIQLLKGVELPAELDSFAALLRNWDGVLSKETPAGPLYAVWLQELDLAFYSTRMPKDFRMDRGDLRSAAVMLNQLSRPTEATFGPEPAKARDELLRQSFVAAVARTQKLVGSNPQQWRWGQLHTATFRHPLATLGPAYEQAFNLGPVPRSGDSHTPNNTRYNENFQQIHGASYRHVLDLADWDRGLATSTPGQSGQPGSPHYGDLLPLWAEAKYFPLAYSRSKVNEVTQHRLTLQPAPVKNLILPGESFLIEGRPAFIMLPPHDKRTKPQPWIMYAPTLAGYPDQHEKWMHEQFLAAGVAVAGIDVGEAYGSPAGRDLFTAFHKEMTVNRGYAARPCLLGRSRGGLWVTSWACAHPEQVAGLAGIYPVFDLRTYPGLAQAAPAYKLTPQELEARLAEHNPIESVAALAKAKVPALFIHGDEDKVVPLKENSAEFVARYKAAGAGDAVTLIVAKGQGHNYWEGFFRCQELVDFAIARAREGVKPATK